MITTRTAKVWSSLARTSLLHFFSLLLPSGAPAAMDLKKQNHAPLNVIAGVALLTKKFKSNLHG